MFVEIGMSQAECNSRYKFSAHKQTNKYTNYEIDASVIRNFKSNFENKVILIVLGTWCSDSRREVPRLLKILDFMPVFMD